MQVKWQIKTACNWRNNSIKIGLDRSTKTITYGNDTRKDVCLKTKIHKLKEPSKYKWSTSLNIQLCSTVLLKKEKLLKGEPRKKARRDRKIKSCGLLEAKRNLGTTNLEASIMNQSNEFKHRRMATKLHFSRKQQKIQSNVGCTEHFLDQSGYSKPNII